LNSVVHAKVRGKTRRGRRVFRFAAKKRETAQRAFFTRRIDKGEKRSLRGFALWFFCPAAMPARVQDRKSKVLADQTLASREA